MLPSIAVEINNRIHDYKKIVNLLNMNLTDEEYRDNINTNNYGNAGRPRKESNVYDNNEDAMQI